MTKDSDFVDLVGRLDKPPQIVWLTVGNTSTAVLKSVLSGAMTHILERLNAGDRVVDVSHA